MGVKEAPDDELRGKTVLITGANSGIGKATAIGLAEFGADLVLVCRNKIRAQEAIDQIKRTTGNDSVELIVADLLRQNEVRRAVSDFVGTHSRLDVLINNAGSNFHRYEETEDGIEQTMALNYFAPFLLSNLLLDLLKKSAPSRIVNVSSIGHFGGRISLEDIARDRSMGVEGFSAYQRSKLALVLFTYELARRVDPKLVTVNCLHPGAVRTQIWNHVGLATPLTRLASLFMKSAVEGAKTSIFLATSREVDRITGKYYDGCKEKTSSRESYDQILASKLWDQSMMLTGLAKAST